MSPRSASTYPHLRSLRHPLSDRADRHGLGVRRTPDRGDERRRRLGHPRRRDDDARRLEARSAPVKERTDASFGVNMRADQPDVDRTADLDHPPPRQARELRRTAAARSIQRLKDGGVLTMPTIGAPRHAEKMAEWGVDAVIAQGHEGGGHTGPIPTSLLLPAACRAVDIPCSAPAASTAAAAWSRRSPTAPTGSRWAPASSSHARARCPRT